MGIEERADERSRLESIARAAWWVPEILLFAPVDILTVGLRSAIIPRTVKETFPSLACRRYHVFQRQVTCSPVRKYAHKELFKALVCRHCDTSSVGCTHWKAQRPR